MDERGGEKVKGVKKVKSFIYTFNLFNPFNLS